MQFKGVIFDLGGVVFESPIALLRKLEEQLRLPLNALNRHIFSSPSWAKLERGLISPEQFVVEYNAELDALALDDGLRQVKGLQVLVTILEAGANPRKGMAECLRSLRQLGLKTAALTNNFKPLAESLGMNKGSGGRAQPHSTFDMFDVVVESSVCGLRKPDPKIYELVCQKLGLAPSDCIFLDDIGANLKPAGRKMRPDEKSP